MIDYRKRLIGKRFGQLIITDFAYINKDRQTVWKCKCDCGKETIARSDSLRGGKKVTCGDRRIHYCKNNSPSWEGFQEISLSYFNKFKFSAKKRDREFNITIEYIWDLFLKQNRKCALSGIELKFSKTKDGKDATASLDRIDSSKGYIKGNVQWVYKKINFMKQALPEEEFINLCYLIVKQHESRAGLLQSQG